MEPNTLNKRCLLAALFDLFSTVKWREPAYGFHVTPSKEWLALIDHWQKGLCGGASEPRRERRGSRGWSEQTKECPKSQWLLPEIQAYANNCALACHSCATAFEQRVSALSESHSKLFFSPHSAWARIMCSTRIVTIWISTNDRYSQLLPVTPSSLQPGRLKMFCFLRA